MKNLYIITGPPGVGKSTISKRIAELGNKSVLIEGDDIYHQVIGGYVQAWIYGNHLSTFWKVCLNSIRIYLDDGYDVVFNYIIDPEQLEIIKESFKDYNVKLIGTAFLAVGVFLMIEKKESKRTEDVPEERTPERRIWLPYAVGSAAFAALTTILAKVGISDVESNLGTAIRTCVVLVMAWLIVFLKGKQGQVKSIDKKELRFILLSGIATGASWLCYYYAVQKGSVSVVVPIDKLSILVAIAFSWIVFKEKLTRKAGIGLALMVIGTLAMAIFA